MDELDEDVAEEEDVTESEPPRLQATQQAISSNRLTNLTKTFILYTRNLLDQSIANRWQIIDKKVVVSIETNIIALLPRQGHKKGFLWSSFYCW